MAKLNLNDIVRSANEGPNYGGPLDRTWRESPYTAAIRENRNKNSAVIHWQNILPKVALGTLALRGVANQKKGLSRTYEDSPYTKVIQQGSEPGDNYSKYSPGQDKEVLTDNILFIDIDANIPGSRYDKSYSTLILPTVPRELNYDSSPQWATIASIGRNAPFYNYSGSEDTLTFEIDWYSREDKRDDVIYACRWMEAMSKSDGYDGDPHRLVIEWGKGGELFKDDVWIVHKAAYRLTQFQKHRGMLPQQAYQEIVLKKVITKNTSSRQVMGSLFKPMDDTLPPSYQ